MKFKQLALQYPNKTALITGAASGLGFAITQFLLEDGWRVHGLDINVKPLREIQDQNLEVYQLDITDTDAYTELIKSLCEKEEIDILFNNAGVGEGCMFDEYCLENWDWIININLKAVLVGIHQILPHFKQKNSGMIVNMASAAGFANLPKMSPYNVTKAAVISLSETLSHELSTTNIKVRCVTPTFFQSGIMQHSKGKREIINSAEKVISGAKLTSGDAARIILSRLSGNREFIRFPFNARILYFARHYLPFAYRWGVRRFLVEKI